MKFISYLLTKTDSYEPKRSTVIYIGGLGIIMGFLWIYLLSLMGVKVTGYETLMDIDIKVFLLGFAWIPVYLLITRIIFKYEQYRASMTK